LHHGLSEAGFALRLRSIASAGGFARFKTRAQKLGQRLAAGES